MPGGSPFGFCESTKTMKASPSFALFEGELSEEVWQ